MAHFKDHFSSLAAQYAESRPRYPAALFQYLAGLCPQRGNAWDCACGSGQATISLTEHFESVIGTDASAKQIDQAIPHPRISYRVAPAEDSGLEAGCMDLVTVAQALHWFDIEKFYAEVDRVLRPDGIFAVWCYGIQHIAEERIDLEVQAFYHEVVGPYWPPERRLVEAGYQTLSFPFEELSPPQFELQATWELPRLLGYFRSWSATGRYMDANDADPVAALGDRLAAVWGDPSQPRSVTWPLALRVGRRRSIHNHQ
jgi:SAM-dependent methyltransferase